MKDITMADITHPHPARSWKLDKAWAAILLIPVLLAIIAPAEVVPMLRFALGAIGHTGIFILFAVAAVAYMKATGAETLLARAFEGREGRMIVLAALMGGLSPFCSCEVIPFIAAMLALGAPLSAVMAFWLSSPLMDPAMFLITAGTLGVDFAVAKTLPRKLRLAAGPRRLPNRRPRPAPPVRVTVVVAPRRSRGALSGLSGARQNGARPSGARRSTTSCSSASGFCWPT
jgi:hypothetical protein